MIKSLRNAFFSGVLLLLPIGVTVLFVGFLMEKIGAPTRDLFFPFLREELKELPVAKTILNVVSTLIVVLLITIVGWFSKLLMGRMLVQAMERLMTRVPLIKNVYLTVKQIVDTFSQQNKAVFQKVVLLEFPRKGCWAIGFLTGTSKGEVQARTSRDLVNVFLPTTPNPTSGYLVMIPREDMTELDMTIAEGMKLIISGGAVAPVYRPQANGDVAPAAPVSPSASNPPAEG